MTVLDWILTGVFVFYTRFLLGACLEMVRMPWLSREMAESPPELPSVTAVVPACNEEDCLEAAIGSLLASEGVVLRVLLVNDRSNDDTGRLADQLARADERLRVIHIEELPEGWLGKVHAMHVGAQEAKGDYILFADADVRYEPRCLARAVAWAEREGADHLSLMPRVQAGSVLVDAAMLAFGMGFLSLFLPSRVNRDEPGAYIGVGAFNMVRRASFETTEGWPWLRLEVADDVGLGLLMNRHGLRTRFANAVDDLSISWYESLPAMIRGLEKNAFWAGARGSVPVAVGSAIFTLGPVLCLGAFLFSPWLGEAVLATAMVVLASGAVTTWGGGSFLPGALAPLLGPVLSWILLRSAWRCTRAGGIEWRGTHYSLEVLREGRRVNLKWQLW